MTKRYFIYTFDPTKVSKHNNHKITLHDTLDLSNCFDTKTQAENWIKESGDDFTHYTIITEYYKTPY